MKPKPIIQAIKNTFLLEKHTSLKAIDPFKTNTILGFSSLVEALSEPRTSPSELANMLEMVICKIKLQMNEGNASAYGERFYKEIQTLVYEPQNKIKASIEKPQDCRIKN